MSTRRMALQAGVAGPVAPRMEGLPVRTRVRKSSATSLPSSSSTLDLSLGARWRGFATVRNELGNCFGRMDEIERSLTGSSSAAPGG